jgi:hypothetical protein
MKNSIKLTALFLLASVGAFAATPSKGNAAALSAKDAVTISSLPSLNGVDVKVEKGATEKAIVIIADDEGNVLRKDALTAGKGLEKGYILNQLENGDYTIAVTANHQTVSKSVHVYEVDGTKQFFFVQ